MLKGFLFPGLVIIGVGAATIGVNMYFGGSKETPQKSAQQAPATEDPQPAPVAATSQPVVTAAPTAAAETATEPKTAKARLLFFMNPAGRPCQMQDAALNAIRSSIEALAEIVYISTTNPADQNTFYQYGIRSLPSLIILNNKGSEAKRFSPGIQDAQAVLNALKEIK